MRQQQERTGKVTVCSPSEDTLVRAARHDQDPAAHLARSHRAPQVSTLHVGPAIWLVAATLTPRAIRLLLLLLGDIP